MEATDIRPADDDDKARSLKRVQDHAAALAEHFDSVQIICTRYAGPDGTTIVSNGAGNFYTRYGSVTAWVKQENRSLSRM